ncbi:MAG: VOC family protein [Haliea sp.]|uniref:VOC family protein n=1 Tax=Haliea sp. TaxID=1932666 RepID=UPI0032EE3F6D
MSIKRIHHLNFVVANLDHGIADFEKVLGGQVFEKDELPQRGVVTARARVGEQWFVLVQPTDFELAPGRHLREKGEGFFLLSLEVDSMEDAVRDMERKGVRFTSDMDRKGLLNWWVRDLGTDHALGEQIQLCEERD